MRCNKNAEAGGLLSYDCSNSKSRAAACLLMGGEITWAAACLQQRLAWWGPSVPLYAARVSPHTGCPLLLAAPTTSPDPPHEILHTYRGTPTWGSPTPSRRWQLQPVLMISSLALYGMFHLLFTEGHVVYMSVAEIPNTESFLIVFKYSYFIFNTSPPRKTERRQICIRLY